MHDVLDVRDLLADELVQRRESGYAVDDLAPRVGSALARAAPEAELERLLGELERAPRAGSWGYEEPSERDAIEAHWSDTPPRPALDESTLRDRLHAAWLGRCAGCALGKPLEGVECAPMRRYLELAGAYPLDDYVPVLDPLPDWIRLNPSWSEAGRGRIRSMPRDDDTDYTILGLHVLETYGPGFRPADVGREWLARLPFLRVYTAERAAYRNLVHGLAPPRTAWVRNPYREWIGAQIRADVFGYVSPGDPHRAARLAFADASLSHVANGLYGAQWAAALIAACFTAPDMRTALDTAATVVPPRSRLAEALGLVRAQRDRGLDWETAHAELRERYGALSFVHTINNAAVVAAALEWGEGDFTRTIGLAVQGGWDTDCNGVTAGSAFGAMHGRAALPDRWVEPLSDTIRSALFGYDGVRISELAERTLRVALRG